MPTPYEMYKGDWAYVDELESIIVYPIGDEGQQPSDSVTIEDIKAHRGNLASRDGIGGAITIDSRSQRWIIFAEGLGGYRITTGVEFDDANGNRWRVLNAVLAVFDTRWIVQAEEQPVTA